MKKTILLCLVAVSCTFLSSNILEAKHHKHSNHSGRNFGLGFGTGLIGGSILGAATSNRYYSEPARIYYTPTPIIRTTYYTQPTAIRRTTTYYSTPVYRPVVRTYYSTPVVYPAVTYYEPTCYYY